MAPSPSFLVGRRVDHTFMIKQAGKKRRRKTVCSGTVTRILRESNQPLVTLFKIVYDFDQEGEGDSDDEEEEVKECLNMNF